MWLICECGLYAAGYGTCIFNVRNKDVVVVVVVVVVVFLPLVFFSVLQRIP